MVHINSTMKKAIFILGLAVLPFLSGSQITYQKLYGDALLDDGQSFVQTSDGGYCVVGSTGPLMIDSADIALYRLNSNGDLIWSTRIIAAKDDFVTDVVLADDGSFVLTGYTFSSPLDPTFGDIFVARVDDIGNLLWAYTYGGSDRDEATGITKTNDGGFVIVGSTQSYGTVLKSALAFKIDANGQQVWANVNSMNTSNYYYRVDRLPGGDFIAAGGTFNSTPGGNGFDHYVTRFSPSGSIVWSKRFGGANTDLTYDIAATGDGGFIAAGSSTTSTIGDADNVIYKLTSNGNLAWVKNIGTAEFNRSSGITPGAQGRYVVCGITNVGNSTSVVNQASMFEMDSTGTIFWSKSYGDFVNTSEVYKVINDTNGGFAAIGFSVGFTDPYGDAYMIKIDATGQSGCYENNAAFTSVTPVYSDSSGANSISSLIGDGFIAFTQQTFINQFGQNCFSNNVDDAGALLGIALYPNPAGNTLTFENPLAQNINLTIHDVTGRMLISEKINGLEKKQLQVGFLSQGVYTATIQIADALRTLRFIKE